MSEEYNDDSSGDETTFKFFCDYCDYGTKYEFNFTRHLNTDKHHEKIEQFKKQKNTTKYKCTNCDKFFKHHQSMYRHRKDCVPEPSNKYITGEEFTKAILAVQDKINENNEYMLKTNSEYQSNMLKANTENNANMLKANTENTKAIVDACVAAYTAPMKLKSEPKKSDRFNVNEYLNVKCNRAITLNEFLKQMEPTYEDMVNIGNYGYIEGNAQFIFRYLEKFEQNERPIQCTDTKRYTVYMKNDNGWEKDDDKLTNTNNMVDRLCNRTYKGKKVWVDKHPNYEDVDTKDGAKYLLLVQTLTGHNHDLDKMNDAIVKKLAKYCAIKK